MNNIVLMLYDGLWSSPTIKAPRQISQADPSAIPAAATDPKRYSSPAWGRQMSRG